MEGRLERGLAVNRERDDGLDRGNEVRGRVRLDGRGLVAEDVLDDGELYRLANGVAVGDPGDTNREVGRLRLV